MDLALLFISSLVVFSILLIPLSIRIGAPLLLVFLTLGMLAGEDGVLGIPFNDFELAHGIGSLTLAFILFSGGIDTPLSDLRRAFAPAFVLATLGVILTAGGVGLVAWLMFDLTLAQCLLLGAVVGSTDAAATFLLLRHRGIKLTGKLRETLLAESGLNDPMAIFLTVTLVVIVDEGAQLHTDTLISVMPVFIEQIGIGALVGIAAGIGATYVANHVRLPEGTYAPFVLASAMIAFAGCQMLGGSGYLAVYLAGVLIRARLARSIERICQFHDGIAWLSQIVMFAMLGLLVTPHQVLSTALPSFLLALALIFIVRPLTCLVLLPPFGFSVRSTIYVGWVGLRGAVPIFLAIIPVISPGPMTSTFFNVVFVIVGTSLLLQGWTIGPMARWLKVAA